MIAYLVPETSRFSVVSKSFDWITFVLPLLNVSHVLVASLIITGGMGIKSGGTGDGEGNGKWDGKRKGKRYREMREKKGKGKGGGGGGGGGG